MITSDCSTHQYSSLFKRLDNTPPPAERRRFEFGLFRLSRPEMHHVNRRHAVNEHQTYLHSLANRLDLFGHVTNELVPGKLVDCVVLVDEIDGKRLRNVTLYLLKIHGLGGFQQGIDGTSLGRLRHV